ncbi:MAG: hypothetical protein O2887_06095 [Bacteroidetes bacterium]|nr:hypothetical protein [Bacteroidota bacterium]MDA1120053.1 hypothetical protein [Bacteroidota bacterium]
MNKILTLLLAFFLCSCQTNQNRITDLPIDGPIQLHPKNPHYFLFKGKPLALITSAEHYGAVLNLDFDYKKYISTLSQDGMNYTRIFTGTYFEIPGESFGINNNTLAPMKNRVITPWPIVVSDLSGDIKYDLSSWNEAYFARLKDFISLAADNNIIVEVTLFSSIYRDGHWDISPQNPENNINIAHEVSRQEAQTLNNGTLLQYQGSFVRKMVTELNEYDNFFFEIQNEPWADHAIPVYNIVNKEDLRNNDWTYKADFANEASMAWHEKLADAIVDEESKLDQKHLIAQNYTNFKAPIPSVGDNISIINFHYAWPEAVVWNYHYNKVIGFDESGFAGSGDQVYRRQAWQFMLSGGGLFNSLDYSFFVGNEDGLGENQAPGGGSRALRQQLKVLSDFIHSFELEKMRPNYTSVTSSPGLIPYILSDGNNAYAIFLRAIGTEKSSLRLKTGDGTYLVRTLNTTTGAMSEAKEIAAVDGLLNLDVEIPDGELALRITRN